MLIFLQRQFIEYDSDEIISGLAAVMRHLYLSFLLEICYHNFSVRYCCSLK